MIRLHIGATAGLALLLIGSFSAPPDGALVDAAQLRVLRGSAYTRCQWLPEESPPAEPNCNTCVVDGSSSIGCNESRTSSANCSTYTNSTDCVECQNTTNNCPGNATRYMGTLDCSGSEPVEIGDCAARNWVSALVRGCAGTCP